jgi:GLPGLI family protein
MKSILSLLLGIAFVCNALAQKVSHHGIEVIYHEARKSPPNSPPETKKFFAEIPAVLLATKDESLYEKKEKTLQIPTDPKPMTEEEKQRIKSSAPPGFNLDDPNLKNTTFTTYRIEPSLMYTSFTKNISVSTRYNHQYLVEDKLTPFNWELTGEVATIAGLPCRKATHKYPSGKIAEAWFTDQIPFSAGPLSFHGLPGLILKVSWPGGTIEAQKITFVTDPVIKEPTEGQRIKQQELQQKLQTTPFSLPGGTTKN